MRIGEGIWHMAYCVLRYRTRNTHHISCLVFQRDSHFHPRPRAGRALDQQAAAQEFHALVETDQAEAALWDLGGVEAAPVVGDGQLRSEEHTSELQSPTNLVC